MALHKISNKKALIKGVQYQYGYDAEDRLITVNYISGNKIASYTYDAEGNRSTKTTYSNNNPINTTTYHYYNGELLYETLSTDPATLYIRTPVRALEAVSLNYVVDSLLNTFYYYHYNAHGDVVAVTKTDSSDPTNLTGKIYRQYTYDPYGNIISAKDGSGNTIDINNDSGFDDSYLYAGYRYDKESGIYFLKERYYAPGLGRFLTKDSEIDVKNAKSLNAYVYCQDDPVNLADSDGNRPVISDDGGKLVLGYSQTEQTSASRTKKSTKKKTTKKSSKSASKKSEGRSFEAGLSLSAECIGRVSASGGIAVDTHGHIDLAITYGTGAATFGTGVMGFLSTWSGEISNAHGKAINNGFSGCFGGPSFGYDISYNKGFNTIIQTYSLGLKAEPFWEQHCEYTNTFFDFGDHVYLKQFP